MCRRAQDPRSQAVDDVIVGRTAADVYNNRRCDFGGRWPNLCALRSSTIETHRRLTDGAAVFIGTPTFFAAAFHLCLVALNRLLESIQKVDLRRLAAEVAGLFNARVQVRRDANRALLSRGKGHARL